MRMAVLFPIANAGLPGKSACVRVRPPLNCSGPSLGSVVSVITPGGGEATLDAMTRLSAPELDSTPYPICINKSVGELVAPAVLLAMIELCSVRALLADTPLKARAPPIEEEYW